MKDDVYPMRNFTDEERAEMMRDSEMAAFNRSIESCCESIGKMINKVAEALCEAIDKIDWQAIAQAINEAEKEEKENGQDSADDLCDGNLRNRDADSMDREEREQQEEMRRCAEALRKFCLSKTRCNGCCFRSKRESQYKCKLFSIPCAWLIDEQEDGEK